MIHPRVENKFAGMAEKHIFDGRKRTYTGKKSSGLQKMVCGKWGDVKGSGEGRKHKAEHHRPSVTITAEGVPGGHSYFGFVTK